MAVSPQNALFWSLGVMVDCNKTLTSLLQPQEHVDLPVEHES
jgi:hypothetical protein